MCVYELCSLRNIFVFELRICLLKYVYLKIYIVIFADISDFFADNFTWQEF